MLKNLKRDIQKHYYDSTFGGIDLEAHFTKAKSRIDSAVSTGQVFGIIAQTLLDFGDSHTFFLPPPRQFRVEYGWQVRMIGDQCYVVAVRPGSDAEAKGLEVGDRVIAVGAWQPTRDNLRTIRYVYYQLRPQPSVRLIVQDITGRQRELDLMATVERGARVLDFTRGQDLWQLIRESETEARLHRQRYHELGDDLLIWKMPQWDMSNRDVGKAMKKARKFEALILDLRGNPGGFVSMLERLTGYFFDHDITIADLRGRKSLKSLRAETRGKDVYTGKLVVVVDSESGSASELFARVIQLKERGIVIGDRTAGDVMRSRLHSHELGVNRVMLYGASVTDADLIMSDGTSLEHVGVTPDEVLLPTMEDLASGRDPVLARAAALVGFELDPEEAGSLFPIEWRQ